MGTERQNRAWQLTVSLSVMEMDKNRSYKLLTTETVQKFEG